jgi:hypothetical protein
MINTRPDEIKRRRGADCLDIRAGRGSSLGGKFSGVGFQIWVQVRGTR